MAFLDQESEFCFSSFRREAEHAGECLAVCSIRLCYRIDSGLETSVNTKDKRLLKERELFMCEVKGGVWASRPKTVDAQSTGQLSGLVKLRPVDSVDVQIIVDNFIDILLPSRGPAMRPILQRDWSQRPALRAEHGYSLLFTVHSNGGTKSVL